MEWLDALLSSGVRMTTPILLAALACLPTLWTRDINIGLEGVMIFGAFFGIALGIATGSALTAVLLTLVLAAAAGLCFGLFVTKLKVDVFVGGIVLFVFAGAATAYLLDILFGVKGNLSNPGIPVLGSIDVPLLEDVPLVGGIVSGHSILSWLAVILAVVLAVADRRTVIGVHFRAAGSRPEALSAAGVSVVTTRVIAQVWCFALAALAGIEISTGQLGLFTVGMVGGVGFVALAVVIFARGSVGFAVLVSACFGIATAVSFQFDKNVVPHELTQMLPYAAALIALVLISRRSRRPRRTLVGV
ncbi:ABC transporter permease [Microbacterium sp. 2FI]|uniref:ABC transporter permease n=1 Tax=Microbacterium sp. 2FI TaxID=2502193 RepID=UPI0010F61D3C|nr:ABC transporter permease [Microbacterium sp. 2FI]